MLTNETSYDSVVLTNDTGLIRGLPTDGGQWKAENSQQNFGLSANIVGPCNSQNCFINQALLLVQTHLRAAGNKLFIMAKMS